MTTGACAVIKQIKFRAREENMKGESLKKAYEPKDVEEKWYNFWEDNALFKAEIRYDREPFCIVIPPPNITGHLHMGHALNNTIQDIICRYKRMKGFNVLWQPGTDHAGIATQNVVERELASRGINRYEIGREKFIQLVWEWKERYGNIIITQLKRLGCSCDWSRTRFTMDEGLSRAVREVFVRLYEEGLIYRGDYIINWCPRCHTALADIEVEHEEKDSFLYYIRYPFKDGEGHIVVATTRPETLLGDTAVAVNPEDKRYKKLHGKIVLLPVLKRPIPIITDSYVDMEFGTGALKITPAHDLNDFEIGNRHGLERVKVIDEDGKMNELAGPYKGMDRFECREVIIKDLETMGLLEKIEPYKTGIGHCYRCKTVIEPLLSKQWFVKVAPLARKAIEAVEEHKTRIVPDNWETVYFEWMNNIRDWCISRQIWWGHRIPAWHCKECGHVNVAREEVNGCNICGSKDLVQDEDVLDTWFSSALWPFSTLGWPDKTQELKLFYPTSLLVTGFDILFFWVARMMMMGLHFMGDVPFRDVYIHALVRDAEGKKMSKSKGNVIDPLHVMEKFGTDAFRFTLAALAAQGRDIKLSEEKILGYRHFVNKIWNAARFVLMNMDEDVDAIGVYDKKSLGIEDRWIITRLSQAIKGVTEAIENYRFNEAAGTCYQFVWHEFCDWYVEMSKWYLYGNDILRKRTTQAVLLEVLSAILRLLHPFMPFVTEEIWQKLPGKKGSIMISRFPESGDFFEDQDAVREVELIKKIITGIRNIRGELKIPPSKKVNVAIEVPRRRLELVKANMHHIKSLAKVDDISVGEQMTKPDSSATTVVGDISLHVALRGVLDVEVEKKRIVKEIKKIQKDIEIYKKKLANKNFVEKAPAHVVEEVRDKLITSNEELSKLNQSLSLFESIS